ncbi:MAG: DUF896 domain-containing protein [Firmicutes bacterium]|nr:DUF896 domain-containing protein [Bacillota bacterium]
MDPLVARINELYKKSKESGLTEEEKQEQAQLRQRYINNIKRNLINTLDNTVIVDPDGNRRNLKRSSKKSTLH